MKKRIVVFAPHPDDETWGCGGTIAKKITEEYEVIVVVMTDGRHAFEKVFGIDSDPSPTELKAIRREELLKACDILGVQRQNLIFLDFEDGSLEKSQSEASQRVAQILKENKPVEVYFPHEKDFHVDHRVTNRVVKNEVNELGIPTVKYKYITVRRHGRVGPIIDALVNPLGFGTIRVDITEFLPLKKAALDEYESEIAIISRKQKRPLIPETLSAHALRTIEVFFIDK
jgi:LmbE family N-acetylglucosaminyl deacetylase